MEGYMKVNHAGRYLYVQNKGVIVPLLSKDGELVVTYETLQDLKRDIVIPESLERYMVQAIYGDGALGKDKSMRCCFDKHRGYLAINHSFPHTPESFKAFLVTFKKMHDKYLKTAPSISFCRENGFITACQPNENGLVEIAIKPAYLKQRFWMTLEEQDEILRIAINEGRDATYNWLSDKVKEKELCDYKFEETILELRIYFQKQYGFFSDGEVLSPPNNWKVGAKDTGMELGGLLALILAFMIPLSIGISMIYGALWIVENTKPGIFGLAMIPVLLLGGLAVLGYLGEAIKRLGK